MGISTIASYRNSALFDIIGLCGKYATGVFYRKQNASAGLTYEDIEQRIEKKHKKAFEEGKPHSRRCYQTEKRRRVSRNKPAGYKSVFKSHQNGRKVRL